MSHSPGYKQMEPNGVLESLPIESNKYNDLREALEKAPVERADLQFDLKRLKPLVLVSVTVISCESSSHGMLSERFGT